LFFFSSRRRHTRSYGDWSSDVCSSDLVALVERFRLERLDQVVHQVAVLGKVHVVDAEELLGLLHALLRYGDGLVLLVRLVVVGRSEERREGKRGGLGGGGGAKRKIERW